MEGKTHLHRRVTSRLVINWNGPDPFSSVSQLPTLNVRPRFTVSSFDSSVEYRFYELRGLREDRTVSGLFVRTRQLPRQMTR